MRLILGFLVAALLNAGMALSAFAAFDPSLVGTKSSITDFRNNGQAYQTIHLLGNTAAGDDGGGDFNLVATDTTSADNGCTIIVDAVGHRYYRDLSSAGYPNSVPACKGFVFDPRAYGFVGDGSSHPLSGYFATLGAAQVVYPFAKSLTDEIDGMAMQAALYAASGGYGTIYPQPAPYQYGGTVVCPATMWRFNEPIIQPSGVAVVGQGAGLNGEALPYPVSGATHVQTCLGYWTGNAVADNAVGSAWRSIAQYQNAVPTYAGTTGSATATTLVFNASGVAGIANGTFVGALVTDSTTSETRTITAGSYSAPNYTATIVNPWTTTPSGGDTLAITSEAKGAPYMGNDGIDGNCLNYAIGFSDNIRIENVALATDTQLPVGFDFHCASQAKLKNTTTVGFNVGRNWDESYQFDDQGAFDVSRQIGVLLSGASDGVLYNGQQWPYTTSSGGSDIYRPTASDRPGLVGSLIASGSDPGYYLNTGIYGNSIGPVTILHGNPGQSSDRSVFWTGSGNPLNIIDGHFERQGAYPTAGPVTTGATGIWSAGSKVVLVGINWLRDASGTDSTVPLINGCTPILSATGISFQTGTVAPTFAYTTAGNVCGSNGTFTFGGYVTADITSAPTPGDSAPFSTNGRIAGSLYQWARYPTTMDLESSSAVTLNNCTNPVMVDPSSNAVTVTLPATVAAGLTCEIVDYTNNAATHHITITSQTGNFNTGSAPGTANDVLSTNGAFARARALGAASGWAIVP